MGYYTYCHSPWPECPSSSRWLNWIYMRESSGGCLVHNNQSLTPQGTSTRSRMTFASLASFGDLEGASVVPTSWVFSYITGHCVPGDYKWCRNKADDHTQPDAKNQCAQSIEFVTGWSTWRNHLTQLVINFKIEGTKHWICYFRREIQTRVSGPYSRELEQIFHRYILKGEVLIILVSLKRDTTTSEASWNQRSRVLESSRPLER